MGTSTETVGEKVGTRATLVVFGMSVGMLVMRILRGSSEAYLAVLGLVVILGVVVALTVRVRQVEHGDDEGPTSWGDLAVEAITGRGRAFVFFTTFLTFLFLIYSARADGTPPRVRVGSVGPAIAGVAGLALLAAVVSIVRRSWRIEGIERQVFLESTCIGFFVMVVVAGTAAILEVATGEPALPAWALWVGGVGTWALASGARSRHT